ncbi:Protein THALLO [Cardamine amara subsp. amara]|uniref:Protein THALLO n=1 Tax=Cardamine amara subsp. amara TaxID=228776 RepID=A0ABD0ZJ22_CARAN
MGKKGGTQKRSSKSTKTRKDISEDEYDDEIDAFHKQRDIVPLDVDDDIDDSDEDDVQPVFDLKGVDDESDDESDEEDEDEEESENGLTAKMIRQKKYLRAKFGDGDDEMADDDKDKDEEEKRNTWGKRSGLYRGGDNVDIELQSSDDEDLKAEEEEALRLQAEQAGSITAADAGLDEDSDEESDRELTMEEISVKGKQATKSVTDKKEKYDKETHVEEIKKDINSLSKEEQMDVVYSSAPEIVGLLSELNDSVKELESKINPIMSKLKEGKIPLNGGTRYLEVKQLLLLTYCQSITFYLLLKSEGQPIRDHPILARLVDIKSLLDKIKEIDGELPPGFEESLARSIANETVQKVVKEDALSLSVSDSVRITKDTSELMKIDKLREEKNKRGEKRKHQNDQVDMQSEEMLKLRAALEGKLRSNGVIGSTVSKSDKAQKRQKLANRKLETFDDYVDDADNSTHVVPADTLTKLVSTKRKPKTISGDDDLPQRDDIGERRRKFELRVLAGAGVKSEEDGRNESGAFGSDGDDDNYMVDNDGESEGSEDEFYKQEKLKQEAKRAAKAEIYSRKPHLVPSLPESVDGKRVISQQMKSNRGLTRPRNRDLKNPRKKYRDKHRKKLISRQGQVRNFRNQTGPYSGERHAINPTTSRSIRIKS